MTVATEAIYEAYASVYDAIGQGRWSARMAVWALDWLARRDARPRRVLDLACGTGEAALAFAQVGCDVVGVDRSAAMLAIAQGKARDAGYDIVFVESDIRELKIENAKLKIDTSVEPSHFQFSIFNSQYDLVTCFYDSLNYLTEDGDLDRVFRGVAGQLRPGGHLIFDVNTVAEYTTWDERDRVTYDGDGCMVYNKLSYDADARLARGRIVWFVREIDRWWRGEETHVERAWGDGEVRAALMGSGLGLVGRWDSQGSEVPDGGTAPRVVYVARKG
jgi:SAM-dependent methyltransferase